MWFICLNVCLIKIFFTKSFKEYKQVYNRYEGIKLIKEDIVELESSKTSTQNTITKLEEELIKLEDFATVIDYNLTDYMNNNSFLLINLETKIEG